MSLITGLLVALMITTLTIAQRVNQNTGQQQQLHSEQPIIHDLFTNQQIQCAALHVICIQPKGD